MRWQWFQAKMMPKTQDSSSMAEWPTAMSMYRNEAQKDDQPMNVQRSAKKTKTHFLSCQEKPENYKTIEFTRTYDTTCSHRRRCRRRHRCHNGRRQQNSFQYVWGQQIFVCRLLFFSSLHHSNSLVFIRWTNETRCALFFVCLLRSCAVAAAIALHHTTYNGSRI